MSTGWVRHLLPSSDLQQRPPRRDDGNGVGVDLTAARSSGSTTLFVWHLAERLQSAVRSDSELDCANTGGAALLVIPLSPSVLNRDGVVSGRQHGDVRLRARGGRAQRNVVVEEKQLLRSRLAGDGRDDLHPVQAAIIGMSPGDFHPVGAWDCDRYGGDGPPHRVGCRPVGLLAGPGSASRRSGLLRRHLPTAPGGQQNQQDHDQRTHAVSLAKAGVHPHRDEPTRIAGALPGERAAPDAQEERPTVALATPTLWPKGVDRALCEIAAGHGNPEPHAAKASVRSFRADKRDHHEV
jgi:hypothetical protein